MSGAARTRWPRWPVLAALALLALAAALAGRAWLGAGQGPAAPPELVVIATNTDYVGSCPVSAARERGYFAAEGILAVLQPHSSGKAAMEAVLRGKANLGTVADIPVMFAGLNGQPVAVIATIFNTQRDHGIVGRRDRGVLVPGSLKGKRIGVTLSTSGHFLLDAFLNRQRLRPDEVSMHNYPPEALAEALAHGDVDAIASWEPFLETARAELGANAQSFDGQDIYESIYNVAGMRPYIGAHPETIRKVLRALRSGARFCSEAPEGARQRAGARPAYRFNVALDQGLILALEDEARWAIKNHMSERSEIPNYLDLIYLDGLEAVQPSAVTVIH